MIGLYHANFCESWSVLPTYPTDVSAPDHVYIFIPSCLRYCSWIERCKYVL